MAYECKILQAFYFIMCLRSMIFSLPFSLDLSSSLHVPSMLFSAFLCRTISLLPQFSSSLQLKIYNFNVLSIRTFFFCLFFFYPVYKNQIRFFLEISAILLSIFPMKWVKIENRSNKIDRHQFHPWGRCSWLPDQFFSNAWVESRKVVSIRQVDLDGPTPHQI